MSLTAFKLFCHLYRVCKRSFLFWWCHCAEALRTFWQLLSDWLNWLGFCWFGTACICHRIHCYKVLDIFIHTDCIYHCTGSSNIIFVEASLWFLKVDVSMYFIDRKGQFGSDFSSATAKSDRVFPDHNTFYFSTLHSHTLSLLVLNVRKMIVAECTVRNTDCS